MSDPQRARASHWTIITLGVAAAVIVALPVLAMTGLSYGTVTGAAIARAALLGLPVALMLLAGGAFATMRTGRRGFLIGAAALLAIDAVALMLVFTGVFGL